MRLEVGSEAPENIHNSVSSAKVSTRKKKKKSLTSKGILTVYCVLQKNLLWKVKTCSLGKYRFGRIKIKQI